jgi:hypothetical protein
MSDTDTTKLNLYQKLLKITEAVGTIEKTGRNSQQNYAFIEQAQIVAELRPQLAKWGVVIIPETVGRTVDRYTKTVPGYKPNDPPKEQATIHANVVSRYTVVNADNPDEKFTSEWDGGEALDTSDKATNKAITASYKTYVMKLFNISDKEDADSESPEVPAQRSNEPRYEAVEEPEPATKLQKAQITSWLRSKGVEDKDIVKTLYDDFGIVGDLTRDEGNRILTEIKALKEAEKAQGDGEAA